MKHIPEIERQSREAIRLFQDVQLKMLLEYLNTNSAFYSGKFKEYSINIKDIGGLDDMAALPVTTKEDLHRYNDDFLCVPKEKVIDMITTSGTLGDPVTFAMTDKDLDRLAYNEYLSLSCAGTDEHDVFQLMTTIDRRFMAGLAYFLGANTKSIPARNPNRASRTNRNQRPEIYPPSGYVERLDFKISGLCNFRWQKLGPAMRPRNFPERQER